MSIPFVFPAIDHDNQRELKVLKRAEGDGEGFIVIDDLVDTGGIAVAIREMYPKRTLSPSFAKPAGRPLVDDYVVDIPQNTPIEQPWDMGVVFVPPRSGPFQRLAPPGVVLFNFRRVTIVSSKYSGGCIYDTGKPERNPTKPRFKHPETRR